MERAVAFGTEVVVGPGVEGLGGRLVELARTHDRLGLGGLWVSEAPRPSEGPGNALPDPLPLAGAVAACLRRGLVGVGVGIGSRHPAVLAKQVTTLDVMARGGAGLLVRAGGATPGHLVETVAVCRALFRDHAPYLKGPRYALAGAVNLPRPVRPGGPFLMAEPGPWGTEALGPLEASVDAVVTRGPGADVVALRRALPSTAVVWRGPLGDRGGLLEAVRAGASGVLLTLSSLEPDELVQVADLKHSITTDP